MVSHLMKIGRLSCDSFQSELRQYLFIERQASTPERRNIHQDFQKCLSTLFASHYAAPLKRVYKLYLQMSLKIEDGMINQF